MTPRAESILLGGLIFGVSVGVATAIDIHGIGLPWTDALKWVLPALLAGAFANAVVTRKRRTTQWTSAGAMALSTLLWGIASYVLLVPLYVLAMVIGSGAASFGSPSLGYVPLAVLFALLDTQWAVVLISLFQYALCRRYLRRVPAITGRQ